MLHIICSFVFLASLKKIRISQLQRGLLKYSIKLTLVTPHHLVSSRHFLCLFIYYLLLSIEIKILWKCIFSIFVPIVPQYLELFWIISPLSLSPPPPPYIYIHIPIYIYVYIYTIKDEEAKANLLWVKTKAVKVVSVDC